MLRRISAHCRILLAELSAQHRVQEDSAFQLQLSVTLASSCDKLRMSQENADVEPRSLNDRAVKEHL